MSLPPCSPQEITHSNTGPSALPFSFQRSSGSPLDRWGFGTCVAVAFDGARLKTSSNLITRHSRIPHIGFLLSKVLLGEQLQGLPALGGFILGHQEDSSTSSKQCLLLEENSSSSIRFKVHLLPGTQACRASGT
ncbi:hypothetical protein PGT21_016980 [Puccinia graminis f. sp. tritici]|uniref:Uncharacterized protein n=1 Tax=Puccinia graminis f. sp. tritici TaxID=56615 RepID=A0A5B0P643_PUCGR|nr:hypothetical protein PGT21_016980 [Puccinia graminis f. sp. tritici]